MQEQREEAAAVRGVLAQRGRRVLRRHQHHQRHVEVVRERGEGEGVVRVHHEEGRPPGEGEEVARVEAAVLLEPARVLAAARLHVALGAHQHPAQVVAGVVRARAGRGGEGSVRGDVKEQRAAAGQLLVAAGEEHEQLRQRGLVQQVLVRVVPPRPRPHPAPVLEGQPDGGWGRAGVQVAGPAPRPRLRVAGFPLQRLQHPEHVQGQLRELHLVRHIPHDDHLTSNALTIIK